MIELCRNQVMTAEVLSYHLLPCKIEIELETPSKRNMFIEIQEENRILSSFYLSSDRYSKHYYLHRIARVQRMQNRFG